MDMEHELPPTTQTPALPPARHGAAFRATAAVERLAEHAGDKVWHLFKRRPLVGVGMAGLGGIAAAMTVGVGELAIGIAAGYAVYQMLKESKPPSQAIKDAFTLEKEIV